MAVHKLRKVPFNDHIMASSEGTITKHVQLTTYIEQLLKSLAS